jgi:hypothetical protein
MAKAKKGDLLSCELCGLVVVVDEVVGMSMAELICCEERMGKGKAAAEKAKKKAALTAAQGTVKKVVKTAIKAAPAKASVVAKKVDKPVIAKAPAKKAASPAKAMGKKAAAPAKKETKAKK